MLYRAILRPPEGGFFCEKRGAPRAGELILGPRPGQAARSGEETQGSGERPARQGGASGADFATTERDKVYLYLVRHPELGETEALAENRLRAVCAAAKIWGVPWTSIATACKCERVEKRE